MDQIKYKIANPEASFTDVALHFNYFDQAHFNYDFKRICGVTPSFLFKKIPAFFYRHQK